MNINAIKNIVTNKNIVNTKNHSKTMGFSGYKCPIRFSKLTLDNLGDAFAFTEKFILGRGNKQCMCDELNIYAKNLANLNPEDNCFFIAKDLDYSPIATAGITYREGGYTQYPLLCCFKDNVPKADTVQNFLLNKISKFAEEKGIKLYAPYWCNAMDESSKNLYKKYNIDIKE